MTSDSKVVSAATDVRTISTTALALIGLINWLLASYVFHGTEPSAVSAALMVLVPAGIGFLSTHIALNIFPPKQLAKLKADFAIAAKGSPIIMPPYNPVVGHVATVTRPEKTKIAEPPSNVHIMHVHQDGIDQIPDGAA
jgi:hypothetical protein